MILTEYFIYLFLKIKLKIYYNRKLIKYNIKRINK